jgi:hypothetical protein
MTQFYDYLVKLPLDVAGKFLRYCQVTQQSRIKVVVAALNLLFKEYEAASGKLVPLTPEEIEATKQARRKVQ